MKKNEETLIDSLSHRTIIFCLLKLRKLWDPVRWNEMIDKLENHKELICFIQLHLSCVHSVTLMIGTKMIKRCTPIGKCENKLFKKKKHNGGTNLDHLDLFFECSMKRILQDLLMRFKLKIKTRQNSKKKHTLIMMMVSNSAGMGLGPNPKAQFLSWARTK